VDADPSLLVNSSFAEGIVNAVAQQEPSLVLVGQRSASAAPALGGAGETVASAIPSPVAIVVGEAEKIREVVLIEAQRPDGGERYGAAAIAAELAARIGGRRVIHRDGGDPTSFSDLTPGQLCIAPTKSWQALAASDPPEGAAAVMVLDPPPPPPSEEERALSLIRDARI
jgi:hypothetical protein